MYFFLGLSDKDLEDILGGGEYKPDKNKGRKISLSSHTPNSHSDVYHSSLQVKPAILTQPLENKP